MSKKKRTGNKKVNKTKRAKEETPEEIEKKMLYIKLVKKVKCGSKREADLAFEEIANMMKKKMRQITGKFNIKGFENSDIDQEALYALRFKAIKDYDKGRSSLYDISSFDKFAALCIRRHLSTVLKSSFKSKNEALNSAISLDKDRCDEYEDDLSLRKWLKR
jgi:hypothetical protein